MEIKVKPWVFVMVIGIIVVLAGGYFYVKSTAELRTYMAETKQLRLISEHQEIEIKVIEQKAKLELLTNPPMESPEEQELRRKREQELRRKAEDPNE